MRLAKNEAIAKKLFQRKLDEAVSGQNIIYVISEKEHLSLLPEKAFRILVTADLDTRCFDNEAHDIHVVSGQVDLDEACVSI